MLGPAFFLSGDSFPADGHVEAALKPRLSANLTQWMGQQDILARTGASEFQVAIETRLALLARLVAASGNPRHTVAIGRSSGARVASLLAARAPLAAAICLGYPFRFPHERREPDRFMHLARLDVPVLILQGRHDPYGGFDVAGNYPLSPMVRLQFVDTDHEWGLSPVAWDAVARTILQFCNEVHPSMVSS
jgi:predicted alpha/beta-hydrolase family hydrolase